MRVNSRSPHLGHAGDDDGALLDGGLELLLGRLVQLADGGFRHGVRAVQHEQLRVGGGQRLAHRRPQHGRLLRHPAARQLGLGDRGPRGGF